MRTRKLECSAARPVTEEIIKKVSHAGDRLIVLHEDVAFTEAKDGLYCCVCGMGPLGSNYINRVK